jgi:hypothetical protein
MTDDNTRTEELAARIWRDAKAGVLMFAAERIAEFVTLTEGYIHPDDHRTEVERLERVATTFIDDREHHRERADVAEAERDALRARVEALAEQWERMATEDDPDDKEASRWFRYAARNVRGRLADPEPDDERDALRSRVGALLDDHVHQVKVSAPFLDKARIFEDYEEALIVMAQECQWLLDARKNWTGRGEGWVQFGTNYSWVLFEVIDGVSCPCGRQFKTRRGLNAHRGARGNCPDMKGRR